MSNIPGGSFTARHDLMKGAINSLILDSGLLANCEVFSVFRDLIAVEALTEEEDLQTCILSGYLRTLSTTAARASSGCYWAGLPG